MVRLVVIAVVIFLFNRWFFDRKSETDPQGPRGESARVEPSEQEAAEIRAALRPTTRPAEAPGIGVAILVDTSGSMKESVRTGDGGQVVKMTAAKEAVKELIATTARIKAERLKLPVMLGVYEFSERQGPSVRAVVPLGAPDLSAATEAVERMLPEGGTPIGAGIVQAKRDLDEKGLSRQHILVVTDGANTAGHRPEAVLQVMGSATEGFPASVYFVAFDVDAATFGAVKEQGGTVLPAASPEALREAVDGILTERILVE